MLKTLIVAAFAVAAGLMMIGKPTPAVAYASSGIASYYWEPQMTASGERFNPNAMTAAHKSLPLGSRVRVTNVRTGKSIVVRINDRGPYIRGRIIDLSSAAASALGMRSAGLAKVRIEVLSTGKSKRSFAKRKIKNKAFAQRQLKKRRAKARLARASRTGKISAFVASPKKRKRQAAHLVRNQ